MANLLNNPVYVSNSDVRDTTDNTTLASEDNDVIDKLITRAQYVIDNYLNGYGTKYESDQSNIFPIKDKDGNSYIPDKVKIATIYAVENLYNNIGGTDIGGKVTSESLGYYKVSYAEAVDTTTVITDKVKTMLAEYYTSFVKQVL